MISISLVFSNSVNIIFCHSSILLTEYEFFGNNTLLDAFINPKFFRPAEVNFLLGDSKKAKKQLKWTPKVKFKKLVEIMIKDEIKYY